jgi:hypothetical protein
MHLTALHLNLSQSFSHKFDINNQHSVYYHSVYYHFYIEYQCLAFLEKCFLDSTCTNEINQEGQNEKQTYKPMCSGRSQSTDRTQDNDILVNTR